MVVDRCHSQTITQSEQTSHDLRINWKFLIWNQSATAMLRIQLAYFRIEMESALPSSFGIRISILNYAFF